jgi:hypothetical protein
MLSLNTEIDAYRDFLQPLGTQPLPLQKYLEPLNTNAHPILTDIYNLFAGRKCLVMALEFSDFFHLGTINELLDLYLNLDSEFSKNFRQSLGFTRVKNSQLPISTSKGCILNSKLGKQTSLSDRSIMEYCVVGDEVDFRVGHNCFLSNCMVQGRQINNTIEVFDNICMNTVPVNIDSMVKYVTVFFNKNDDLKKTYDSLGELQFLGKKLPTKVVQMLNGHLESNCVWNLKIFKSYESMSESFLKSLEFVNGYLNENVEGYFETDFDHLLSLFNLLRYQNFEKIISYRQENGLY